MVEANKTDKNPNLVEMAKKKRHIFLIEKLQKGKTLTPKELKELAAFESGPNSPGIVPTQEEVAEAFKVSVRTVAYWARDGMPVTEDEQYDIREITAWRMMLQGRGGKKKNPDTGDPDTVDWETEYRKFKALLIEIDYEKALGDVIPREDVEKGRVARILAVKRALIALPRALAPQLIGSDPREIEAIIMDRIREVISKFAGEKFIKQAPKKLKKTNKKAVKSKKKIKTKENIKSKIKKKTPVIKFKKKIVKKKK